MTHSYSTTVLAIAAYSSIGFILYVWFLWLDNRNGSLVRDTEVYAVAIITLWPFLIIGAIARGVFLLIDAIAHRIAEGARDA